MVILDSSYLIALLSAEDSLHDKAVVLTTALDDGKQYIPYGVFQEITTVLCCKKNSHAAIVVGNYLLSNESSIVLLDDNRILRDQAWERFQNLPPHSFSFTDVLLIKLSSYFNCPLVTFDKEFRNVADVEVIGLE